METRTGSDTEQSISLWYKCTGCNEFVFRSELERNFYVCSYCGHLFPLGVEKRLEHLLDMPDVGIRDANTGGRVLTPAKQGQIPILAAQGTISGFPVSLFLADPGANPTQILMTTLLAVVDVALKQRTPLITVTTSQPGESQLSQAETAYLTMEMERLVDASLPYITVLTETEVAPLTTHFPVGEIVIAERAAAKKTPQVNLQPALHAPEEQLLTQAQTSEAGVPLDISVDCYVTRAELRNLLGQFLKFFAAPTAHPLEKL